MATILHAGSAAGGIVEAGTGSAVDGGEERNDKPTSYRWWRAVPTWRGEASSTMLPDRPTDHTLGGYLVPLLDLALAGLRA